MVPVFSTQVLIGRTLIWYMQGLGLSPSTTKKKKKNLKYLCLVCYNYRKPSATCGLEGQVVL